MTTNLEMGADLNTVGLPDAAMPGKGRSVREVFENVPRYLKSRRVDMAMRIEAVSTFASNIQREQVMDVGCGDGSISLPLLDSQSHLTLLDLSANMLARARASVPEHLAGNVEIRNENFQDAAFAAGSFDLIVTVGVMAHVDSPDEFLRKIKCVLRPGGHLILEFTDGYHFVGRLDRFLSWLKERIAPGKYATNRLSAAQVMELLKRHHFRVLTDYRYSRLPIPGIQRVVSAGLLTRIVRAIFGKSNQNRNAWLGNEHICFLRSDA